MDEHLILVIDDEPIQHMVLEEYLSAEGFRVAHANNGAQGLEKMYENSPDLILLDVQMPIMDGFQTIDAIRSQQRFKNVPVLFLTSQESPPQRVKGLDLGADDYIIKPFHREELIARIKAVFRRTERSRKKEGEIEGDISEINLCDLLKTLESGGKTGSISLDEIDAKIFIENGQIVHARIGAYKGDEALSRIFLFQKGFFYVNFKPLPDLIPRAPRSLRAVLINVMAQLELAADEDIKKSPNRMNAISKTKQMIRETDRSLGTSGIMEGDLSDISLADLLQSMELGMKTANINLPDIDAEIFTENGELILIRQGSFTSDQALVRIFLLERGYFSIRFDELPAKITYTPKPITSVLMSIIAEVDELKDIIKKLKVQNVKVNIGSNISEFPKIEKFKRLSPIDFIVLLTMMEGDLKENLSMLIKATKQGKITKAA